MHFRRRLISIAVLFCVTFALMALGSVEMPDESGDEENFSLFSGKKTLYFWYTDESMSEFFNSAAVAFGEENNVRVITSLVDETEYLEEINEASLYSENGPDVYVIESDSLEKAYLSGLAAPIQDDAQVCTSEYFPQSALNAVTYHDKLVAYPLAFETTALIYNSDYLDEWAQGQAQAYLSSEEDEDDGDYEYDETGEELGEAGEESGSYDEVPEGMSMEELTQYYSLKAVPQTVDDILNIADTFDVPEGVEGIMKWDAGDIFYNYWVVGNYLSVGGETGDDENVIRINNDEVIGCLKVYSSLNEFFAFDSEEVTAESALQDFIDGKIVFTIGDTKSAAVLEEAKSSGELEYEYGIALIPDLNDDLKSRTLSITETVAVNGYSKESELANAFAAYLVNECCDDLYEWTGKVSANLYADADNDALSIFKEEYAISASLPKMLSTGNYWIELEAMVSKVWNGGDVEDLVSEFDALMMSQITGRV